MATTNFDYIATTVTTRFNTQMATSLPTFRRFVDNDVPQDVDPADSFALLNIIPADSQLIGLGSSRTFRDYGNVVVQLCVPKGEGTGTLWESCDKVRDIFLAMTVSGVTFRVPRVVRVGPTGSHYQMNVVIPYFAHFQAA